MHFLFVFFILIYLQCTLPVEHNAFCCRLVCWVYNTRLKVLCKYMAQAIITCTWRSTYLLLEKERKNSSYYLQQDDQEYTKVVL